MSEPWLVEPRCAACTAQVTTSMNPSKYIEEFLAEMVELLPNSEYRKRGKCPVKEMCDAAVKRGFTNLLIFTEVTLTLALTLTLTLILTLILTLALALTLTLTLTLTLALTLTLTLTLALTLTLTLIRRRGLCRPLRLRLPPLAPG